MRVQRVLAISSGGGHWVQLLRLRPAFTGCDITYAATRAGYRSDLDPGARFDAVPDCNRHRPFQIIRCTIALVGLLIRVRPDIVISTGALPGFLAIFLARKMRIRTIWIDSVANAEELSLSGQRAGRYADLWLTQWEHLARPEGPKYFGSVL